MDLTQFLPAPKIALPYALVEGGLPQGGLIEISGTAGGGRIEALLRFLAENAGLQAAWVEEGATIYPCAFPQHGVGLERVLFVNAEPAHPQQKSPLLDCAHQILKSGIFGALILIPTTVPHAGRPPGIGVEIIRGAPREIELRRLQIAAEKSGTTVFIVREKPSVECTWPLAVQLCVSRVSPSRGDQRGEIRVQVLKRKHYFHSSASSIA